MASVVSNKTQGSVTLHFTGNNETIVIAGNSSVSNIANPGEFVTSASVAKVIWGTHIPDSHIVLRRGANTIAIFNNSGEINYNSMSMPITLWNTANLSVEFVDAGNAYCMIQLNKISTANTDYFRG